jgi:hypothetical protein
MYRRILFKRTFDKDDTKVGTWSNWLTTVFWMSVYLFRAICSWVYRAPWSPCAWWLSMTHPPPAPCSASASSRPFTCCNQNGGSRDLGGGRARVTLCCWTVQIVWSEQHSDVTFQLQADGTDCYAFFLLLLLMWILCAEYDPEPK